jgi:hypothetical protein
MPGKVRGRRSGRGMRVSKIVSIIFDEPFTGLVIKA